MEKRPAIPEQIKRGLRREAKFGCVVCGSPIIEYHHIEPYHRVRCHQKENLVALCPEHHHRANCGELHKDKVIKAKNNPFNSKVNFIRKDFCLTKYEDIQFKLGGTSFKKCPIILEINNEKVIWVSEDNDGYALFSAKFYDDNNILLAEIIDNEWRVYTNTEFWDIKYSPGNLKINNKKRQIYLEFKIEDNIFNLRATLYYKGNKISFLPNETKVKGLFLKNVHIESCRVGVSIQT